MSTASTALEAALASVIALGHHYRGVLKRLKANPEPSPDIAAALEDGMTALTEARKALRAAVRRQAQLEAATLKAEARLATAATRSQPAKSVRESKPAWAPVKSRRAETPPPTPTPLPRSGLSRVERQRIWDAVDWSLRDVDIARQLAVDPSAVGVRRRRRGAQPTLGAEGVMCDTVIRLTLAGNSAALIATELGVAESTVQHHLREARKAGIVPRPVPAGQVRAEVARLRASGLTRTQIATLLGLSVETVRYHVKRLNAAARDET